MRLGISLPTQRPDGTAPSIREVMARARLIERLGFDGIWLGESIGRGKTPRPDPLTWLLAAGAATERVELGTAIIQVPLRHPVELAQRLLSLHALLPGRFCAGLGAGSTRADFEAVGVDYSARFRLFGSGLAVIRQLCQGESVGTADLNPWPNTLGGPPIVLGAWASGVWVGRAARSYDGWMASGYTSFNAMQEGIQRYRDAGGKRAMVATVDVDLSAPDTVLRDDEHFTLHCGPRQAAERLERVRLLGFDDVCLVRLNHTDASLNEEQLVAIRALVK